MSYPIDLASETRSDDTVTRGTAIFIRVWQRSKNYVFNGAIYFGVSPFSILRFQHVIGVIAAKVTVFPMAYLMTPTMSYRVSWCH
jgi:hypothetical protein